MMQYIFLPLILTLSLLYSQESSKTKVSIEASLETSSSSSESNTTRADIVKKEVEEQIKREKKYAKEQTFYQGREYNLSAVEVNKESLSSIPKLEPDYDFDMDDVYSDIQ